MNDIHQITDRERELMAQLEKKSSAIQKLWADRDALAAENEWLKEAIVGWRADQKENLKNQCDLHMENVKLREAVKLALEALNRVDAIERGMVTTKAHYYAAREETTQAIAALKEALGEQG